MINLTLSNLPKCSCGGTFLPLTDEGRTHAITILKAWVCLDCHKNISIRNGELQVVERITRIEERPR